MINWTDGRALIATGSPFDPVEYKSTTFHIAQANNALVFPGIGLGVIVCKAEKVSDNMIAAASSAVANAVTDRRLGASLLPPINHLRSISAQVAIAVVEAAKAEGLARKEVPSPIEAVYKNTWKPIYPKVEVVDSL